VAVTASSSIPPAGKPAGMADQDWRLDSLGVVTDFLGDASAPHARITNLGSTSRSAFFTISLFQGGQVVAALKGVANHVAAGNTVTVSMTSQDKLPTGNFAYQFQVDATF
jgi:hypothetical protein